MSWSVWRQKLGESESLVNRSAFWRSDPGLLESSSGHKLTRDVSRNQRLSWGTASQHFRAEQQDTEGDI